MKRNIGSILGKGEMILALGNEENVTPLEAEVVANNSLTLIEEIKVQLREKEGC